MYGPLAYMTTALLLAKPPVFKPFTLALIQLGNIGANKSHNLNHAREMILKAANGESGSKKKPDLIVLPVFDVSSLFSECLPISFIRNVLTRRTGTHTSRCMLRASGTLLDSLSMS